jgi:DNA-binding FadR family transcriptional regulator
MARRRPKQTDVLVDAIKRWIVEADLKPGAALPNEAELQRRFAMSKGTVREALKALEAQGLVSIRTGPRGGATLTAVPFERTFQLLANHWFFQAVDLDQVYGLRRLLEPEMAAQAAAGLSDQDLAQLEANLATAHDATLSPVAHGAADLAFHDILADACPNLLLGLQCRILNEILRRQVAVSGGLSEMQALNHDNIAAHEGLMEALRHRDAARTRVLMTLHIAQAEAQVRRIGAAYRRSLVLDEAFEAQTRLAVLSALDLSTP